MNTDLSLKDEKALELLSSFQEGNQNAFATIYNMYVQMMLNFGQCLTSNTELVKDCIHDVFIKLFDKRNTGSVRRVSSYLIISLRNRLVDEFRRNTYTVETAVEDITLRRVTGDVENDYVQAEYQLRRHHLATTLLDTLTPRQRQAFQLYYIEERKYDEICEIMHMNYHSVRNLVHRGMLRMRQMAV